MFEKVFNPNLLTKITNMDKKIKDLNMDFESLGHLKFTAATKEELERLEYSFMNDFASK